MSDAGASKNPKEAAKAAAKADKASKRREVNTGTNVALGEHAREAGYVPRFKKRYNDVIKAELMKKFGYTNALQVPKLNKVVLNIGAGEAASDGKKITQAQNDLTAISGQKPLETKSRKSIASFKLRDGMTIGAKVTLRRERMYEFIDRLTTIALPRVKDFRGLNGKSFDGRGNFAMGIKEHTIFPEISYDNIETIWGMDIIVCTTARTNEEAKALLTEFGFPFRN